MTPRSPEPEREFVRRVAPFGAPAAAVAFLVGWLAGGLGVGWSAGIGVTTITLNLVASGMSVSWAGRRSDSLLFAVSGLGVLVRLGVIVGLIAGLRHFAFFSTVTFALAVVPATVLLLGYEMRLMAGGVGRELRLPAASKTNPGPEIHREVVP